MLLRICPFSLFFILVVTSVAAQPESWYIEEIAKYLKGQTEIPVENGRIDIVTETHAIEVERASNWKHSIGQSLWYAQQKNLSPGIVLLVLDEDDWKMGIRLNSTLQYAGLSDEVKVWYYPQDFGTTSEQIHQKFEQQKSADPSATGFWLTVSSGVRHNSGCRWYTQSKGRYCSGGEGKACGSCGG